MPNIDLSILNQRQTPAFFADTLANRPAAGFLGRIFVSTDTFAFYRDNGTGWDLIGGPGTGTITGTGASGQIALWNGASTITGDTGLTYDGTANSLTADKFIVSGGTSSQFLKGDGSLDSSTYLTTNIYNGNGTLSGERTISLNGNNLIFDGGSSIARVRMDADTNVARIFSFATNNLPRFAIRIDGTESGSDAGSDFAIRRYNDAGTFVDAPFSINRATGQSTFAKKVVIENNTGDQQLQIVSSTAPSLRIDNLQTGATRRIGIGLATTTNNFIQGTTGGEMAIFNSSTTASPILFGVYDAGLSNTQEAARISAARNFLIGTTTDAGFNLDVNGIARISGDITTGALLLSATTIYGVGNVGLVNRSADTTLYMSSAVSGFTLLDNSQNTMYKATPTSHSWSTSNTIKLQLNNDGNLGLGVTPSAWSITPALQVVRASIYNQGDDGTYITSNGYFNAGWKYIGAFTATQYQMLSGQHRWLTASSGTAGNAISFTQAMTLAATGNLLIGTTTDNGSKLQVNGNTSINGTPNTSIIGGNTNLTVCGTAGAGQGSIGAIYQSGGTAKDTLISINQSTFGATALLLASVNFGTGTSTASAVYLVRFYYDGNNAPTTVYLGGSSDFVTFGVSGSNTLTLTNTIGGLAQYSWFINK